MHTGTGKARVQVPYAHCQGKPVSELGTYNTNTQREYVCRDKDSEGKPEVKNTMQSRNTHTPPPYHPQEKQQI